MAKYWYEKRDLKWDYDAMNFRAFRLSLYFRPAYRIDIDGVAKEVEISSLVIDDLIIRDEELRVYSSGSASSIFKYGGVRSSDALYCYQTTNKFTATQLLEKRIKKNLVETLIADEDEYPENGIQGDYWYIKKEKAFPELKINGQSIGGAKIKDSTGQVRAVGNVYFKDNTGTVRNLK